MEGIALLGVSGRGRHAGGAGGSGVDRRPRVAMGDSELLVLAWARCGVERFGKDGRGTYSRVRPALGFASLSLFP